MLDSGLGIPLRSNHESAGSNLRCLWLSQEDLTPSNLESIKDILKSEKAPLKYWLLLAFSYQSLGHLESFDSLLKDAESSVVKEKDSNYLKGSLYSSLGFHNLSQAFQFKNDEDRHSRYMNWTNHYTRKTEALSSYHYYLLKGHQNLMNFVRDKNTDHLSEARSMFQMAASANQSSIIAPILFANVMVMSSNYQVATVYYLKSLMMTTYYLSIVENLPPQVNSTNEYLTELELLKSQLTWVKATLLFALSSCQFLTGNMDQAKVLVEKSISVKPLSVSYRLSSSIAAYQLTHFKEDEEDWDTTHLLKEYSKACLASHTLDKTNATSQLQVCEFLFHRGEYEKCLRKLLDLQKLNLPYNQRSDVEYQLGRLEHIKGNYSESLNFYSNALSFKSDFMTARMQLVKVAAGCGDLGLAREHSDFLIQAMQKAPMVLKVASYVYLSSARETLETSRWDMLKLESVNKPQNQLDISCMFHTVQQGMGRLIDERLFKAMALLEELIFPSKYSHEKGEEEAEMQKLNKLDSKLKMKGEKDLSDPSTMEYYIRCLEILVSRGRENLCANLKDFYIEYFNQFKNQTPEFVNNFGVILMYTRNYTRACKVLEELNEKLNNNNNNNNNIKNKTLALTVKFNYGLALEFSGQIPKAQKVYSSLTREYPRYISAWLRKSIIAFKKGDSENWSKYLDQVKKIHPLSCEPYLLRAYHLERLKMFDDAIQEIRKMFRAIPSSSYDPYANTLLTSLMIKKSYKIAETTGVPPTFPKEAMQYSKTALKRPSVCNFYAANCIAVLLALEKNLKASYESFLLLLESLSVTSHMKLLVNKNMGILSSALTLSFMGTEKKIDKNKLNKLKVAKTQQYFQSAISNGKMDKNLYISYIRFLFDVQKYEECISMLENARMIFQDELFTYNQIIVTDTMLINYLRDPEKTRSLVEMNKMLAGCKFIMTTGEYFLAMNQKGESFLGSESYNKLKQILTRVKTKVIPHISSTLPQLEKTCENKQNAREKRLQLQLSIQQAQEAKKKQMEEERIKAAEAEEALSKQLLKEASEIASELLTNKPAQTN